jgi:hypothetical protein
MIGVGSGLLCVPRRPGNHRRPLRDAHTHRVPTRASLIGRRQATTPGLPTPLQKLLGLAEAMRLWIAILIRLWRLPTRAVLAISITDLVNGRTESSYPLRRKARLQAGRRWLEDGPHEIAGLSPKRNAVPIPALDPAPALARPWGSRARAGSRARGWELNLQRLASRACPLAEV